MSWRHGSCECCGCANPCTFFGDCCPAESINYVFSNIIVNGTPCSNVSGAAPFLKCDTPIYCLTSCDYSQCANGCATSQHIKRAVQWFVGSPPAWCNGCTPAFISYNVWERYSSASCLTLIGYLGMIYFSGLFAACIEWPDTIDPCHPPDWSGSMTGLCSGLTTSLDFAFTV